ncbi:hypothetical protein [Phaeodactylibacter luteus]|uniref:DUF4843 domain-containing protein n=1 Tax=Phaeodactylibacter luteus TaxID=1564516 RepID=A0A5C6RL23_9BACT|nr:hypothetical protein [Phaeodactylibacter luteus]TXB62943.1 hypothetical protein FRY97_11410 [Phaeodactylibacter luteus]
MKVINTKDMALFFARGAAFGPILAIALALSGCEDPRPTQREGNLFDPDNAFIRFNYDNQVNEPAKDSVVLSRSSAEDTLLAIPVALSAAPQEEEVLFSLSVTAPDSLAPGLFYTLAGEDGEAVIGRNLSLPPGTFDYEITFHRADTLPLSGRATLQLERVSPDFIHLGFPGSGRGRTFELIFKD